MSNAAHINTPTLSPLKQRFVDVYIDTGNATEAAKRAGCKCKTEESFRVRGSQLLKELDLPIQQLLTEAGLNSLKILRTVAQGLDAYQVQVFVNKDTGEITEHRTPDWAARRGFADMAVRLKGGYPKQQMELPFAVHDGRVVITAQFATNTGKFEDSDEERLAA